MNRPTKVNGVLRQAPSPSDTKWEKTTSITGDSTRTSIDDNPVGYDDPTCLGPDTGDAIPEYTTSTPSNEVRDRFHQKQERDAREGALVVAGLGAVLVIAFAAWHAVAVGPIAFLLIFGLLRLTVRWNQREDARRVAENLTAEWKRIAAGKEEHIVFLTRSLNDAFAYNRYVNALIRLVPEADRITDAEVRAEIEHAQDEHEPTSANGEWVSQ